MNLFSKNATGTKYFIGALLTAAFWSCSPSSSSSGAGTVSSTGMSGAISSGAAKIKAGLPGGGSRIQAEYETDYMDPDFVATPFAVDLDSTQFNTSDLTGISTRFLTPKAYLQYLVNETAEDNPSNGMGVFQRYRQKVMQAMCAFTVLLPDANTDSIPDIGSSTVVIPSTIDTTMASRCPEATAGMFTTVAGQSIAAVVTDVSGESGSLYDIKGVLTGASGPINGASMGVFYYRNAGGVIRFMFLEPGASGSVSLYEYSSNLVRFEYIALTSQKQHFRYILNETTGDTAFYGYEKNASTPNFIYATGVSNTGNTTQAAFALTADTSVADFSDARACIAPTDALTHLGTWAAACTSITGIGLASTPAVVTNLAALSLSATDMNYDNSIKFTTVTDLVSAAFP